MEEDVGVKAPVTRLRRRLSVEQSEDVSSPATPTKKRAGRLAAKPQLELINENADVGSLKKTRRKSVADEEKPATPLRRSTRAKSNTSIVSDSLAQTTDSPRARRALRRNSQAGSDNEGPATPARTRRTRKDSTSSVENQETAPGRPLLKVAENLELVITEEPENEVQKPVDKSKLSPNNSSDISPNSARKSKRLSEKTERRSRSYQSDLDTSASEGNKSINTSMKKGQRNSKIKDESRNQLNNSVENKELTDKLSESNRNLLKTLDADSKVNLLNHNKSTTDLNVENNETKKKKRNRTESMPSVKISPPNDATAFSDSEHYKKKKSLIDSSNPDPKNTSSNERRILSNNESDNSKIVLQSSAIKSKNAKDTEKTSDNVEPPETLNENSSSKTEDNDIRREMAMLFESTPSNVQTEVYFEDPDSNDVSIQRGKKIEQLDSEDQCVPVIKHDIELEDTLSKSNPANSKEEALPSPVIKEKQIIGDMSPSKKPVAQINDSCEPMDVDETIHEVFLHHSQKSIHESRNELKSLDASNVDQPNKSKRKFSTSDPHDKSKNENKSTLILSQIKDVSVISGNTSKSPKVIKEALSKSISEVDKTNKISKTNLSLNDIKGTPLKQHNVQKLTMQTSTPITTTQPTEGKMKIEDKNVSFEKKNSDFSKSIDESYEDCDEPSKPKNKHVDDEAEEASDDYESGDSRDEEDRQYEDEHEIVERGETLGSDDGVSNDTDYEKDSFVVSSDAEDNELLSGSGEDLSMSDNELTMSKKSKKKFNERKLKEQKNASREMFESRHKLNNSETTSPVAKTKTNRMRIDSSLIESDEEVVVKTKKNNRLRLDSTLDTSGKQASESLNKSNTTADKSISNQSAINEKEITICNDTTDGRDPLIIDVKTEPKTPQKDLNISVVQFTARQEIENVEVSESNSILNQTESDPLQATIAHEDSDSSESEELLQNYDSVLNELNKNKQSKLNNNNISLKLGKKNKKGKDEPIIDQLNLTNTKKHEKIQKMESQDVVDSKTKAPESSLNKQDMSSEDSSNSIDLKLLFSEDNCGSGDENVNDKNEQQKVCDDEEMFIPLRKSTGKTNIPETMGMNTSQQNTVLNESGKKKKKRNSSVTFNESIAETEDSSKLGLNESIKKKNRKSSLTKEPVVDEPDIGNEEVQTLVNESVKKKKKRKSSLVSEEVTKPEDSSKLGLNGSIAKKNRKSSITVEPVGDEPVNGTKELQIPLADESIKKKKKKRKSSLVSQEVTEPTDSEGNLFFIDTAGAVPSDKDKGIEMQPEVVPGSAKKKKNKKQKIPQNVVVTNDDDDSDGAPVEILYRSEKACDQVAEPLNTEEESAVTESGKKKKNKKKKKSISNESGDNIKTEDVSLNNSKKRKRKSSDTCASQGLRDPQDATESGLLNEPLTFGSHKKKRKISHNDSAIEQNQIEAENVPDDQKRSKKKKKNRELPVNFQNMAPEPETTPTEVKKTKKRKERDNDDGYSKKTKVAKDNSFQEVHLPTLPASILEQLEDKPKKVTDKKKVISTSNFVVENSRQKRAKPSNYLEESVYLDGDSPLARKEKPRLKKPKVLPFIPTATISDSGFTSNFKINKVSQNVQFVAEPAGIAFSKERYLQNNKLKKMGTYERYKKHIHKKLSKF